MLQLKKYNGQSNFEFKTNKKYSKLFEPLKPQNSTVSKNSPNFNNVRLFCLINKYLQKITNIAYLLN